MIFSMDLVVFPVSRHFWKLKVSGKSETTKSLEYGKCPETGKRKNSLNTESVWKQGNSKILWTQKMSGNRENRKILLVQKTWLTRGTIRPFRCLDSYSNSFSLQTKLKTTSFMQPQNKPNDMGVTDSGKQQNRLHQQKRDSRGAPTDIGYGKCPETRKWQNPLNTKSVWKHENDKIPWIRKVSRNRKMTKSFAHAWAKTWLTRGTERPFRCLDKI